MSYTFSINTGQSTESTKKVDIFSVLNNLPNNTQKMISPKDIRDAVFTTWANIPFKITTPGLSTIEYIGIDSSDPNNKDIKKRILIGKRSYGSSDILNNILLNDPNSSDIYFYNTKPDSATQSSTKISILAGTNSNLHLYAPYIEAVDNSTSIDMNITNPIGSINIQSGNRVSINGISFPTESETGASASNGRILRYYGTHSNGYLRWSEPTITLNSIGDSSSDTNIWGNTVSVNGHSIEFIEDDLVPVKIGDIPAGFSFSADSFYSPITLTNQNWALSEVLKLVLYPYTAPVLGLTISNGYYKEIGTTASIDIDWSITTNQRNDLERICDWGITGTTYSGLSYSNIPGSEINGNLTTTTYSASVGIKDYIMRASDSGILNSFSYSCTASIEYVNPVYSGFSNTIISDLTTFNNTISTLTKNITGYPGLSGSIDLNYNGSGYMYFIHNMIFSSDLDKIEDNNRYIIYDSNSVYYSSFTSSTISGYTIYQSKNTCSSSNSIFKFIF